MNVTIATGNDHKVKELRKALEETEMTITQKPPSIHEIDAHDVETVAVQKVKDATSAINADGPVLVDDTGLYVEALDEFPGSHASYFIERCGTDGLLTLMEGKQDRHAWFKTTMALYYPREDRVKTFSGRCDGTITVEKRGDAGFGYDPVFCPEGHDKTFAEDPAYKETVSHRVDALDGVRDHFMSRS
ncbi:MAG: RdgB/HAM1 family non-canonical purine NTP pyrophosphatase [Candidatus Nanohaloarchaeota archaeon QJJ-5]|nr:RdgB/HAM1 family non-canonical purine NTP pyrophosphatase [Candidatus Nanohaloarchaeota archaeon QJJ-5]